MTLAWNKGPANPGRDPDESLGSATLVALVLLLLLVILLLITVLGRGLLWNIVMLLLRLSGLLTRLPRILALILFDIVCHVILLWASRYEVRRLDCGEG
jgi:hypothetical protein